MIPSSQHNLLAICPIPALVDNYIWLITVGQATIVVDPGQSVPVLTALSRLKRSCHAIFITHHHPDHTAGVPKLLRANPNATVYGPSTTTKITKSFINTSECATFTEPHTKTHWEVIKTPGHTLDHLVYRHQEHVFCADVLFHAGCGRVFEGTYAQHFASIERLSVLDDASVLYPAHEYSLANLAFAQHVEPKNQAIDAAIARANRLRAQEQATLPVKLGDERLINPFLRTHSQDIRAHLAIGNEASALEVFTALRQAKDHF